MLAFYDLDLCPVSFDFLHFLTHAWREARKPFHIAVIPGNRDGWRTHEHKPITDAEREWRLNHILYPSARLLGCTMTVCESRGMAGVLWNLAGDKAWPPPDKDGKRTMETMQRPYRFGRAAEAMKAGTVVPFRASDRARQHVSRWLDTHLGGTEPLVTITLRETHTPTRNSNIQAWMKAAYQLQKDYRVVVIRDTETMCAELDSPWRDVLTTCPLASCDLDMRMALYERAAINLSRGGGPFMLCVLSGLPYLFFTVISDPYTDEAGHSHFVPSREYMAISGLPVGSQFHDDPRRQFVWRPDDLDVILDETRRALSSTG